MGDKVAGDPRKVDVAAWCRTSRESGGALALQAMPRLAATVLAAPDGELEPVFSWTARGHHREPVGREPELRLHLQAEGAVRLTCQRCLEPVEQALQVDRTIRFVRDEAQAEQLDEESEDEDVLALPARLDLVELFEDEFILALPLVPMHGRCPVDVERLFAAADEPVAAADEPHPFAALAALRTKPPTS